MPACAAVPVAWVGGVPSWIVVLCSSSYYSPDGLYTVAGTYSSETGGLEIEPNDETTP